MQLPSPSRQTVQSNAWGFALIAIVLAVFSPLLTCNFTSWDDLNTIVHNYHLSDPIWFWSHAYMDLYVPLTYMIWSALRTITTSPWIFHLVNITIHSLSAFVLYKIILALSERRMYMRGFICALFFALHPIQVESVAWCSGLKDLLCGFFVLLAIFLYLRDKYWIATLAFVLGMLSKPTAVVAPLMVLTIDTLILQRPLRGVIRRLALWFILMIPCLWWTHASQAPVADDSDYLMRPLIALDAVAFYLWKIVLPINLCVDYGRTPTSVLTPGFAYLTSIAAIALLASLAHLWRKLPFDSGPDKRGYILLFFIPLLPVLGLIPFDFQTYSTTADHYLYLSLAMFSLALAAVRPPKWLAILLVPLAALCVFQMSYWRNTSTLFSHVLAVNPRSYVACDSLAAQAVEQHDLQSAESFSNRALAINPRDVTARVHLADTLAKKGDLTGAISLLRQAKDIEPDSPQVAINLGGLLAQTNDPGAEKELRRALELAPEEASAQLNLGTYLLSTNRIDEALPHLGMAVNIRPDDPQAHTNLGIALASAGRNAEAVDQLREALRLDPNYGPARQVMRSLGK